MNAIVIYENNQGVIGLAANYLLAIDFLIKEDWLDGDIEIYYGHLFLLKEIFPNWQEEIKSWNIKKFNNFFDGYFCLESMEVYGG